jgi:toxin secretion/phage lysis holin
MLENIYVRAVFAGLISLSAYLFGGLDKLLLALITMMGIDFVTGIIKAIALKDLRSQKVFIGGARKIGMLLIVAAANLIDKILELGGTLRAVSISYFIANEGISVLENWAVMGLPIPKKLSSILSQMKNKEH